MRAKQTTAAPATAAEQQPTYTVARRKDTRWWEVRDPAGELVCLTVYRCGAREWCDDWVHSHLVAETMLLLPSYCHKQ